MWDILVSAPEDQATKEIFFKKISQLAIVYRYLKEETESITGVRITHFSQ